MKYYRMRSLTAMLAALAAAAALPAVAAMMAPPSLSVTSPSPGATIRGNSIPVSLAVHDFSIECANIGKTNTPMGEGHVHVMIDGMNMAHLALPQCSTSFSISTQGLSSGKHMLTVVLASDAHVMSSAPVTIPFRYEAAHSKGLPSAMTGGKPSLRILSPRSGASLGKRFNLVLAVDNFDLSCDLEGRKDVAGWGHVHVFVQQHGETTESAATPMVAMMKTPQGMKMGRMLMKQTGMSINQLKPMMMMAEPGLVGMPCTKTIPVDLSTWHSGPAKIVVQLANNDHMPAAGAAPAVLDVTLK
ncbi:MAG TPA: hypothetical protein VIO32_10225 [Candidatus Baltobacteraceae bacterium]